MATSIPRQPRSASRHTAVREQILDAARQMVVDDGHDNFSLRALARGVGYSPASLYEYFDGKQEILQAVADRAQELLADELRQAREVAGDRLVEVALAYVRFARRHPEDFLLLFGRAPQERDRARLPPDSPYQFLLNQVALEVQRGRIDAGGPRDVERIAYGLWACTHGLAMLQLTELAGIDADFETSDRLTLEAYTRGLRAPA